MRKNHCHENEGNDRLYVRNQQSKRITNFCKSLWRKTGATWFRLTFATKKPASKKKW